MGADERGVYTRGRGYKIIVDIKKTLLRDLAHFSRKFFNEHLINYYQKYEFVVIIQ